MSQYDDYRRTRTREDEAYASPDTAPPMSYVPPYPAELTRAQGSTASARSEAPSNTYARSERSAHSARSGRSGRSERSLSHERGVERGAELVRRDRDWDERSAANSHMDKARNAAEKTFSTSKTGLATGVIGAIVGGYALHEASEKAMRARDKKGGGKHKAGESGIPGLSEGNAQLLSTVIGAAIGGLGANAIEKHMEGRRGKDKTKKKEKYYEDERSRSRSRSRADSRSRSRSRAPSVSSRRSVSRGAGRRRPRYDSGSESDWDSDRSVRSGKSGKSGRSDRSGRTHHRKAHERNLVISRSPSAHSERREYYTSH